MFCSADLRFQFALRFSLSIQWMFRYDVASLADFHERVERRVAGRRAQLRGAGERRDGLRVAGRRAPGDGVEEVVALRAAVLVDRDLG